LDKIKSKFIPSNYKWSKEKCHEEALKYDHRIDFKRNSKGAYPAACLNGWLDEICSHMVPLGNKYKRLIYRFIFPDNFCYIGLTHNPNKRKISHVTSTNSSVYRHTIETGLKPTYEELTDYMEIEQAKEQEEYWKIKSEEQGYFILNKSKTGALGSDILIWTKDKCREEASKYEYRIDFRKNSERAYMAASVNGWLEEICPHLLYKYKKWDKEECRKEALKYNSRGEFYYGSCGAWDRARRNGWLDEICSHMIQGRKPDNYWDLEKCKEEATKYKNKNELRKNNSYVHDKLRKHKLLDEIYKK